MAKHAKCSASAAHRWLNCTAAPEYELQFPAGDESEYAKAGTLAHKFCEECVRYNIHDITKRTFNSRLKKLRADPLYDPEMEKTMDFYQKYIFEKSLELGKDVYINVEVRVDFDDYVPEGFGTSDCVMIGSGKMRIVDYKHGVGVPVSAQNNPQMRLYALGALKRYGMFYPISTVAMSIVQPRITEDVSEDEMTVEELLAWGEQIKPIAQKAYSGVGAEFHEGTWCRFCRGREICRARADNMTALEDFKDLPIEGRLSGEEKAARMFSPVHEPVLTDQEIGDLLTRGARLVTWYNDLKGYALEAILDGREIPGYMVVEGQSRRSFSDPEAVAKALADKGFDPDEIYDMSVKSPAKLEKIVGKKFDEFVGQYVVKPQGKPSLTEFSEKKTPYSPAASDFKEVAP